MRVAVSGGAGFIGSHVVEGLLREGHNVVVGDDLSRGRMDNLPLLDRAHLFIGDLSQHEVARAWTERVAAEDVEVLIHMASPMSHNPLDHLKGMELAVQYLRTIEALRIPTVFVSSSSASNAVAPRGLYGESLKPEGLYGMTKAFIEWALEDLYRAGKVGSYVAVRPSNAYGPREVFSGHAHIHVIPSLIRKVMLNEAPIEVWGDSTQTRPFTYVEDIVDAVYRAMRLVVEGGRHEVALVHGEPTPIVRVLELITRTLGVSPEVTFRKAKAVGVTSRELPPPDSSLLGGWSARWSIERGLAATIEWVRSHPDCLHRGETDSRVLGSTVA